MGKDTSTPSSVSNIPDYLGLANLQAQTGTQLARYNQITPFGSSTWSNVGNKWTQSNTLSPDQQQILNDQQNFSKGVGSAINSALPNINLNGIDKSALPSAPINAGQTAQDAIMSRLTPTLERQREQLRTQMANQGIAQGTEAYSNAFNDQNQRENDLYTQAGLQGISAGQSARNSALQEQIAMQNQPINSINALRNGMSLNVPQFSNSGGYQNADLTGATQQAYSANVGLNNLNQAQNANNMNGLFGLGSAFLSSYPWGK